MEGEKVEIYGFLFRVKIELEFLELFFRRMGFFAFFSLGGREDAFGFIVFGRFVWRVGIRVYS